MPLNVNAKEWQPPNGLPSNLAKIKLTSDSPAISAAAVSAPQGISTNARRSSNGSGPPGARPMRHTAAQAATEPDSLSPVSSPNEFDQALEDELQFEEMFDRVASRNNSAHSTPRASLVGPSPLPSPAASPQNRCPLLAVTESAAAALLSTSAGNGNHAFAGSLTNNSLRNANGTPPALGNNKASGGAGSYIERAAGAGNNADSPPTEPLTEMPTVITHVETAASAAVSAAATAAGAQRRLGPNDFDLLRVVGQGAFGKVFQVRKRDTGEVFAMKVMRKDRILERRHGEYVRAERDALTAVVHPYIVTLRYSFQTPTKLYLVLDFINGGHLFFQLYRAGTFDEALARLYTAELVLAVTHLHSLGFVHRDLKPENVLLDSQGHVRVTDFGLAKGNMSDAEDQRSNSFIGTMEYMAPEVIAGRGHGKAVDWWSVGVLLYEMLCGVPPFRAKSRPALQKLITSAKLKLPNYLSTEASSLLKGFLTKEAPKRLGFGPSGSSDVMKHPFFKNVDWKKLEAREVASPFRPTIRSIESVENFDKIWTDLPVQDSPCNTPVESRSVEDQSAFEGFTYCAPSMLAQAAAAGAPSMPSLKE